MTRSRRFSHGLLLDRPRIILQRSSSVTYLSLRWNSPRGMHLFDLVGAARCGRVRVVVPRVGLEDLVEVTASEDQQSVEAFAADAADPAFGVRPRLLAPARAL